MLLHVAGFHSLVTEQYSIACAHHICLVCLLRARRLPLCLAVVNSAAVNIGVHVSFWVTVFFLGGLYTQEGFPDSSVDKESACNAGDLHSIPGSGRSPGEGKGYPRQCSGLEDSTDSPWGHKASDTTEPFHLHIPRSGAVLHGDHTNLHVTNSVCGFPFLHIFANICYSCSFFMIAIWRVWGGISLWFWFAFPSD